MSEKYKHCMYCAFWWRNSDPPDGSEGECRRRAPSPSYISDRQPDYTYTVAWPITESYDWCGDFAPSK